MGKQYINSDLILVFPSTRRSNILASARYLQETTFINDITRLADYADGSFILTKPYERPYDWPYEAQETIVPKDIKLMFKSTDPFEFMIHGYWFKIDKLSDLINLFPNSLQITAYIELDKYITNKDSSTPDYKYELIGRDETKVNDTNIYTGIKFTDDTIIGTETDQRYILPLFKRDTVADDWYINMVTSSLYKFNATHIELNIDGGIILKQS